MADWIADDEVAAELFQGLPSENREDLGNGADAGDFDVRKETPVFIEPDVEVVETVGTLELSGILECRGRICRIVVKRFV